MLQNLQVDFADLLMSDEDDSSLITPAENMFIYRNNQQANLRNALRNAYPLIEKLVGEDFFAATANQYINQYPSRDANLNAYGEYFSDFLAHYLPVKHLVYLPEVADFEWACHQVFYAADHPALDINALQQVSPERYPVLRLSLHPASRLMHFEFPILQLLDLCKNKIEEITDLESGALDLLIIRRELDIKLAQLTPAEFAFLGAVQDEQSLTNALAAALMVDPHFKLDEVLPRWVKDKTIVRME